MEKFKHACPRCGQHIEYTVDYCGRQIACPSCQTPIIFPAAVPGPAPPPQKPHIEKTGAPPKKKAASYSALLKSLKEFEHWKMVGACLVPFLIVAALLVGASYLRKNNTDQPAQIPQAVATPVGADAWKKMTDMGQVDQAVQYRVQAFLAARMALQQAQAQATALHGQYQGRTLDATAMKQMEDAQKAISQRQQEYNSADHAFWDTFDVYKKLGGQVDYSAQIR